jgi:hypothetical protein
LASHVSTDADTNQSFENFTSKNPYQDLMSEQDLPLPGARNCNRGSKA